MVERKYVCSDDLNTHVRCGGVPGRPPFKPHKLAVDGTGVFKCLPRVPVAKESFCRPQAFLVSSVARAYSVFIPSSLPFTLIEIRNEA